MLWINLMENYYLQLISSIFKFKVYLLLEILLICVRHQTNQLVSSLNQYQQLWQPSKQHDMEEIQAYNTNQDPCFVYLLKKNQ